MNFVVRESNCFVPGCINSSTSDSGKLFFPLPRETSARSNWCVTVGLSPSSTHGTSYCCEDHFNLEEDVENWEQYATWKHEELKTLCVRLKKDAIPHLNLQDLGRSEFKSINPWRSNEDSPSVIHSEEEYTINLQDAIPKMGRNDICDYALSASSSSSGKYGSSSNVAARSEVNEDEPTFAGGNHSSEKIQEIPSGTLVDLHNRIKTEADTDDKDFVNALHTSIEIKEEDPLEWQEYPSIPETQDSQHLLNYFTRNAASYGHISSTEIRSMENDPLFNKIFFRITEDTAFLESGGMTPSGEVRKTFLNATIDEITHITTGKNGKGDNHKDLEQAIYVKSDREGTTHDTGKQLNYNHSSASISNENHLKEHIYTHTGGKPFICNHCSASFTTKSHFKRHMRTHPGEKPFSCNHCSSSFTRKCSLKIHMRVHTGEKPFSCNHCHACFAQKSLLRVHMRIHTGEKPFSCSHCSSSFTQISTLQNHIRTHTGEKPFNCNHCSAAFTTKSQLTVHMRTHTGEKPFSCSHCSSSFTQISTLQNHIRTHTGEKPFNCNHCSAAFTTKSQLTVHMRTHTGEKPFKCNHCSASFAKKAYLTGHMHVHTGEKPYRCSHCLSSFAEKSKLKAHMFTHTGEKPFSCSHCSSSFTQMSTLQSQIRTHTPARNHSIAIIALQHLQQNPN
nr:PREDICTED: zinc finger protein 84-like isoform X6 [Bemisia tabaci]